jgi:hypothetical protein
MVVSVIALIAALGGTAVAGGVLTTKKFKKQALRGPLTYASTTANVPVDTMGIGQKIAATCPSGQHVVGGGIAFVNNQGAFANDSHPTATGWLATVFNFTGPATTGTVTAICVTVRNVSGTPPG